MHIAIIGAGFAGLATAWHLLQLNPKARITLHDQTGIGAGASGIAAGLLHPYTGAHAKLNWQGLEGMQSTLKLLKVASDTIQKPVASQTGLLRVALTEEQKQDFSITAKKYDDVLWQSAQECQKQVNGLVPEPGILITSALTVDCQLYLQGLWTACLKTKRIEFQQRRVMTLDEVKHFDSVVITVGADLLKMSDFKNAPITPVKGQVLVLEYSRDVMPLSIPVNSQAYLVPNGETCLLGATFEKNFANELPDIKRAQDELMPKLSALCPAMSAAKIVDCRAGIRASTPSHKPIIKQINEKCWIYTGLGSKGLLYHSLFAESLSTYVFKESGDRSQETEWNREDKNSE